MTLVKTKTIFKRRIGVYMPTLEEKAIWEAAAAKLGMSASEMVYQFVRERLAGPAVEDAEAKAKDLQKEVGDLTGELAKLRDRVQQVETLNDRLDRDLAEYRAEVFVEEVPVKKLDRQLVHILSSAKGLNGLPRPVGADEIHKSLKIGRRDETRMKALNKNLEVLEQFQLVKKTTKGWEWSA